MVILLSGAPVSELRGGIPYGLVHEAPVAAVVAVALAVNLAVVPLIFAFLRWGENGLRLWAPFDRIIDGVMSRTRARSGFVRRAGPIGLVLLVGVPLPGTGVWTAAFAAFLLGIPFRRAFPSIALGAGIAAVVVTLASLGVLDWAAAH